VSPSNPRAFSAFVATIATVLEDLEIAYAIAGSVASGIYGEPRTTLDVDLTLRIVEHDAERILAAMRQVQLVVDDHAIKDRLRQVRPQAFNIIDTLAGWKADCYIVASLDYDQTAFERRREMPFVETRKPKLWLLAPEDVILSKLVYFQTSDGVSSKHLRDITGMLSNLTATGQNLDHAYLELWSKRLGVSDLWETIRS
jgi:hypothetical protein